MEIMVGKTGTAGDVNQRDGIGAAGQQTKSPGEAAERKEASYNAVSMYGDTLSISKAGKTASSENGNKLISGDTTDGIVIRKEPGEGEHGQESEVSAINLSTYTESELKQMYLDGDITRAEYDEEISDREMRA